MSQADTLVEQGMKLQQGGQAAEAEALFRQALEAQPTHKMALYMLGNALNAQGEFDNGLALLKRAVALYPDFAHAHYSLGAAFLAQNQLEQAALAFRHATQAKPDFAEAWMALGSVSLRREDTETALECFRQVVNLRPNDAQALVQLATVARSSRHFEEAIACYERCLSQYPDNWQLLTNLGSTYGDMERFEEAEPYMRAALALQPNEAQCHYNLAVTLYKQGKLSETDSYLLRAHSLDPTGTEAQHHRWNFLLLNGDFKQGWKVYEEWMLRGLLYYRPFEQPRWDGGAHPDKTLLVYADHGLGDAIHFARYAALASQRFQGRVVLECQPPLQRLFQSIEGIHEIVLRAPDLTPPAVPFDFRIGLMSLPSVFGTTVETIPNEVPYLRPPAGLRERWRERLGDKNLFTIGLCWTGDPSHEWNAIRSVRLQDFAPLAQKIPGLRFVSLQVGYGAEQALSAPPEMGLADLPRLYPFDFAETAAAMQNLNLVISIDSAAAHLAGALGVPTWTLLPFLPDWRWLMEREDSPWYPTMRLFRQPRHSDWQSVLERVENELRKNLSPRSPSLSARAAR